MVAFWSLLHGIVAIGLLGAVTHQGLTVWREPVPAQRFIDRFRSIPAARFANAVVVLYVLTFALGAYVYPTYVLDVKGALAGYGLRSAIGVFQMKEHVTALGLGMLPAYWHYWRNVPLDGGMSARRFLTTLLMLGVWWSLVVGHILVNIKGLR